MNGWNKQSGVSQSEGAGNFLHQFGGETLIPRDSIIPQSSTRGIFQEVESRVGAVLLIGEEGTTFPLLEQTLNPSLSSNGPNGDTLLGSGLNRDRDSGTGVQSQVGPMVCYLTIQLGKEKLLVCIDSGATFSLLAESKYKQIQGQKGV